MNFDFAGSVLYLVVHIHVCIAWLVSNTDACPGSFLPQREV